MSGPFVILGGGPCGLAAAWELASTGHRVIVLEREARVGGLCATHAKDGFRFDLGGHRFVSGDAALSRRLEGLLGEDLLTRERRSVVLHDGRTFKYPLDAADLARSLGAREGVEALLGYARAWAKRKASPAADVTFEDWVVARFGRPLYETFFGPYTAKLWGLSPRLISADWAAERISLLGLGDAMARLAGLSRPPIRTYARRYRYPRFGMGQLYEAMAREVRQHGGEVHMGARVVGLETRGSRVVAVRTSGPSGHERIPAGEVLSTMPLPELVQHLQPEATELLTRAKTLRFRALVFLNLSLARRDFSSNTWMYVASGALRMSRIQEPKRRSLWMAPSGQTSLMIEIPCDVGDDVWRASTGDLTVRMQRELTELGFLVDDIQSAFTVHVEHGYPIYHLGYDEDRRALLREVDRFENLRTAGRQGLFRYVFMDAAMQMGIRAARQMVSGERQAKAIDGIGRSVSVIETSALTA